MKNHRLLNRQQLTIFKADMSHRLMTRKRNKYPRFPHGFVTETPVFRGVSQRTASAAEVKVNSQNDLNRRVMSVRWRTTLMSGLKRSEDRDRLRPRGFQNKAARVNRLHIISTNYVLSGVCRPILTQGFGPNANFLAMRRPVSLEHNVNIRDRS